MNILHEDRLVAYQNQTLVRLLFGAGVVIMALASAVAASALRSGPPPYVVAVREGGGYLATGRPITSIDQMPTWIVHQELERYIRDIFRIENNRDDEVSNEQEAYGASSWQAGKLLNVWFEGPNDPIQLGPKVHQSVVMYPIMALKTANMYRAEFDLVRVPYGENDGVTKTRMQLTAEATICQASKDNPLGLCIDSLDFGPVVGQ